MKKPILISRNDYQISVVKATLEQGLIYLRDVKKEYDKLKLRELTTNDLSGFYRGDEFLKDILMEGYNNEPVIGIKLSPHKIREMIDLPGNRFYFNDAVRRLAEFDQNNRNFGFSIKSYVIEKGDISISQKELDKTIETFSYYAETEKEHDFLEMATKLRDVANESIDFNKKYGVFSKQFLIDLDLLKYNTDRYEINGSYLKQKARA